MKKLILSLIFLLSAVCIYGQDNTPELKRRWLMNERLIDLVDSYDNFVRFSERSDAYSFKHLFRRPAEARVFCDYLASKDFGKDISVEEYINYSRGLASRNIWISNIRKGGYAYRSGKWHALLELDKRISYEDSLGFTFRTSPEATGGDFHLSFDCVWDDENEEFKIDRIDGSVSPRSSFPKGDFYIIDHKDKTTGRVQYGGKPIEFNEYGFAILPSGSEFEVMDDDFVLSCGKEATDDRYELVSLKLLPKHVRARTYLSMTPAGAFQVNHIGQEVKVRDNSFDIELGANIGYAVSLGRSTKVALYTGAGLALNTVSLKVKDFTYAYPVVDVDGLQHIRSYNIKKARDGMTMTDLVVPVFLSFEQALGEKWVLVADVGAKYYKGLASGPWKYKVKGSVILDPDKEIDPDSGEEAPVPQPFNLRFSEFETPNLNTVRKWSYSVFAKLGADYALGNGRYAYVHLGWEQGMKYTYAPEELVQWYNSEGLYPLVYNAANEKEEASRPLMGGVSFKRQGVVAEFGIRFKFGKKK